MKLAMLKLDGREAAAFETTAGFVPLADVNGRCGTNWRLALFELLDSGQWPALREWYEAEGSRRLAAMPAIPLREAAEAPIEREPRKLIGVGMNYREKLAEMKGNREDAAPVLFAKPATSLIGPGEAIRLPRSSARVTAEAELALVIGRTCRNVAEAEAPAYVAGFAASLDMTAADILADNPRYMFRAKSFDTFCGLGSQLVTAEELPAWDRLRVKTVLGGRVAHANTVSAMLYNPWYLVSFLSEVMTLQPGDVILTGTPGSVAIAGGDAVECRIEGLRPLLHPVE